MAAAVTFYIGLVLIVRWHTDSRALRLLAWTLGLVVVSGIFVSRLYLGMHYVSDLVAGIVLGAVSLGVATVIARAGLRATLESIESDDGEEVPDRATRLDQVET